MKKFIPVFLTFIIVFGSVGVNGSADYNKALDAYKMVITQLLSAYGNLSLNRVIPLPSKIWACGTTEEMAFHRTIRVR